MVLSNYHWPEVTPEQWVSDFLDTCYGFCDLEPDAWGYPRMHIATRERRQAEGLDRWADDGGYLP